MSDQLSRRDFLKLASLLPLEAMASRWLRTFDKSAIQAKPNILVIVFDAFSAYSISTYGYNRLTTPNINRLAKRAIVYHNHFAGGSFTSPGTASLLTGVFPWTHRAFRPNSEVLQSFASKTVFSAFQNHYRIAYTHNGWAYTLLRQFSHDIDELIPREKLLLDSNKVFSELFRNDDDIASVSWERAMKLEEDGYAYSLFLSRLYESYQEKRIKGIKDLFPRGIPSSDTDSFLLETATDTIWKRLSEIPQPFLGYFHLLPPHGPYHTSLEFFNAFRGDNFRPIKKPIDIFGKEIDTILSTKRREYDEFILYCDKEFARLYSRLESSGILDNTWLILTSDHGEMHERGIGGHMTDALYQPLVRIPLMIFEPGRQTGMDIYEYTSAVDVLPTLAHLSGEEIPAWAEGMILPPFTSTSQIPERNIYLLRASRNEQFAPLTIASTMLVRENYKLHYYFGYPEVPENGLVRLFDIKSDPEEMSDLYSLKPETTQELLNELKTKLKEVDEPYL
ncbi:MAG TPA: sulfatase-like hydrolase/transferase [Anaerolineales bacterium]|nr:sulfatase-like hydrolase/transferase [Anaerolineales bacterium]